MNMGLLVFGFEIIVLVTIKFRDMRLRLELGYVCLFIVVIHIIPISRSSGMAILLSCML